MHSFVHPILLVLPGSHFNVFSKPGWGGPQEEHQTITKHAPRELFLCIFKARLGGTPRKRPKQLRNMLPGSQFNAFSKPGWREPHEEPQTDTKHAPREPSLSIFRSWLGGTPRRAPNNHETCSQGAIFMEFQSLAEGEARKSPKQARNMLLGSHF